MHRLCSGAQETILKTDILLFIDNGTSDRELTFLDSFIPGMLTETLTPLEIINDVYCSVPGNYSGILDGSESTLKRDGNDDVAFWKGIFSKTGSDHIIKIFADSPFMDRDIIMEMAELHHKYLAEFTYSENLPAGFTCEIISRELVDAIPEMEEKTLALSQIIRSNINQFDIELYYRDPDIRDRRLTFRASDPRDKRVMENIFALEKKIPEYNTIRGLIDENPHVLYSSPSYIEIELTGKCELDCIFCSRTKMEGEHGDMELDTFKKILSDMRAFSLPYTICLGGTGEPMMHPNFYQFMELALEDPLIDQVILETNGLYADLNYKKFMQGPKASKVTTVININGLDSQTYSALHGSDRFDTVFSNIQSLLDSDDMNERLYIQIMKINETEPFLDRYYDFWENYKVPIILQKQNTYMGLIEDRRYSDLTPIERTPCWHLQRDLYILSDGRVGFCKQDNDGKCARGNVENESLGEIFEKGIESFSKDFRGQYHSNPNCRKCDEWYTFNF